MNEIYSYDLEDNRQGDEKSADKVRESADKPKKSADKPEKSADKLKKSADKLKKSADKPKKSADKLEKSADKKNIEQRKRILQFILQNGKITSREAESLLAVKQRRARTILNKMAEEGILIKQGAYRNTMYIISEDMES